MIVDHFVEFVLNVYNAASSVTLTPAHTHTMHITARHVTRFRPITLCAVNPPNGSTNCLLFLAAPFDEMTFDELAFSEMTMYALFLRHHHYLAQIAVGNHAFGQIFASCVSSRPILHCGGKPICRTVLLNSSLTLM